MDELEHFERIDKMMKRMVESLRRSREMHDNLANKIDMARTDAADELIKEVEEYLAEHGDSR
jgi:DNA repair ATPase RecN